MLRTCETCCLWNNGVCMVYNRSIPAEQRKESYCDLHKYSIDKCDMCGSWIFNSGVICNKKIICQQCFNLLDTCGACKNQCGLSQDHSMPQTVIKTFKQGGMVVQGEAINPDLVKKHCPSCECYQNNKCYRQKYNICNKYISILS